MKAAVLTHINAPLEVVELEQEGPKAGEVKVKVMAAGVCMSDWHIMNGDWPTKLPVVPGHEAAGLVEAVGAQVRKFAPGDHVIFSFTPHCGHCRYCVDGRPVLCVGHSDTPGVVQFDGTTRLSIARASPFTKWLGSAPLASSCGLLRGKPREHPQGHAVAPGGLGRL